MSGASLVAQLVQNPPAMWETWVRFLGREDPLEKGMEPTPAGPGRSFKTFPYSTVSFVFQLIHRLAFLFIQSEPLKCSCSFSAAFKGIFRKSKLSFFLPERHPRRFACIVKYL